MASMMKLSRLAIAGLLPVLAAGAAGCMQPGTGAATSVEIPLGGEGTGRSPASDKISDLNGTKTSGSVQAPSTDVSTPTSPAVGGVTVVSGIEAGVVITPEFVVPKVSLSGVSVSGEKTWCVRGDGAACSSADWSNPHKKQVMVLPAGFTDSEYDVFRQEFTKMVSVVSSGEAGSAYSSQHRSRLLYVGYWTPGDALNTEHTRFGAKVFAHPIRGTALTLRQGEVIDVVNGYRTENSQFKPWAVLVVFNTMDDEVTPNASPPTLLGTGYGIAKLTRGDLDRPYTTVHELGHAGLNFLDEYVEGGFQSVNINTLDYLTPVALLDGSWGGWVAAVENLLGLYQYKVSDTLAANGYDNVDVTRYPSRVYTPGFYSNAYEHEGGMFFGRGTYHDAGDNVMNSGNVVRGAGDAFGYAHSPAQQGVVRMAFGQSDGAPRPNDRIRNAGPMGDWNLKFGSTTRVMMFDADKEHHFHPTRQYEVQVSWQERSWETCYQWGVSYPCVKEKTVTAQRAFTPVRRTLSLKGSVLAGLASLTQNVACWLGYEQIQSGDSTFQLCELSVEEMTSAFLPSMVFPMPYQDAEVPASQWFTTYRWRFRTHNGTHHSGWTGWSEFYRVF